LFGVDSSSKISISDDREASELKMKVSSVASGKAQILVVNRDAEGLLHTQSLLESADYRVETALGREAAVLRLENGLQSDLCLLYTATPEPDDLQTIQACRRIRTEQRIVVVSPDTNVKTVVRAIQMGAFDYISQPGDSQELLAMVESYLVHAKPAKATAKRQAHLEEVENDIFFVAASPAMQKIRAQAAQVAKVDIPVLLLGESGAGKEVLARLIHKLSRRSGKPLVKVNCAALPHDLLESELFGYEAGAFTGATRSKPGLLELCDKGTIFLDEIGEMSPVLQAKLLHVLQDGKFSRLGGRNTITSDFRVIAATNIDVKEAINGKTFREDLYYRLNAFTINIPPLRQRSEEIPFLLQHFIQQFSEKYNCAAVECSEDLVRACLRHSWPGNLRELGNFVKRHLVLQDEAQAITELESNNACAQLVAAFDDENSLIGEGTDLKSMVQDLKERAEPKIIERVLVATKWNCKTAAMQLKISYKALLYKMKQYRIFPPGVSGPGLRNAHG
jgi:two-component system response regulator AtoC